MDFLFNTISILIQFCQCDPLCTKAVPLGVVTIIDCSMSYFGPNLPTFGSCSVHQVSLTARPLIQPKPMTWPSSRLLFSISSNCRDFRILVLHFTSQQFWFSRWTRWIEITSAALFWEARNTLSPNKEKALVSGKFSCFNHVSPTSKNSEGETNVDLLWRHNL